MYRSRIRTGTRRHSRPARLGTAVLVAGLSASGVAAAAAPAPPAGLYKGTVTDADGDPARYAVAIRLTSRPLRAGRVAGRVSYLASADEETGTPGLRCRGTLKYRGRSGRRLRFAETIAGGAAADCLSGGTVTLTATSARRLTYRWTQPRMDRPAPTATLTR